MAAKRVISSCVSQETAASATQAVVAIDPGAISGVAVWTPAGLRGACAVPANKGRDGLLRFGQWLQSILAVGARIRVVWERPQVYASTGQGKRSKPNDLLMTAYRGGKIVGALSGWASYSVDRVESVLPRVWKGQVPKAVHNARIWQSLTPSEQATFASASFTAGARDDVLDAIGLAKWYVRNNGW